MADPQAGGLGEKLDNLRRTTLRRSGELIQICLIAASTGARSCSITISLE
ncbi:MULTISPECIES: hypothetical protein [unclassified Streptomyces]